MTEFTYEQKKNIFDRMADEHTTPEVLAKEFKCRLADVMDAVVDVISSRGDGMTECTKQAGKKSNIRKWSDVLDIKVTKTANNPPVAEISEPDGVSIKVKKIDLDNHPESKQAVDDVIDTLDDETNKREEAKCGCNCAKQHEPISVDKLGALAYRLSKLHMSEEMIIKVLNITLGVPEPTVREALR